MRHALIVLGIIAVCVIGPAAAAAERHWQTGRWTSVSSTRQVVDFGPGSSPFDGGRATPTMRAMADVRNYVIESDTLRLELKDVVQVNKRTVDAVVGIPVTFALEKKTVYVRDEDGTEHKLSVTKQSTKHP